MSAFCEEACDVLLGEPGYFGGVEVVEGFAEGFALAKDGDRREASLEAVEHEIPRGRGCRARGGPLVVMVGLHEGVVLRPRCSGFWFLESSS